MDRGAGGKGRAVTSVLDVNWRSRATVTVEEAAQILGVGRSTAYESARTGDLPTIAFGRRLVVPVAKLRRMLGEAAD